MSNRRGNVQRHQHRKSIRRHIGSVDTVDFFNVLTSPELLETTDALLPDHRERLYPPTVTLSMFLTQALNEDGSCQKAVNRWAARRAVEGLSVHSLQTSGYCKARQRLPVEMVTQLTRHTGRLLSDQAQRSWRWRGRRVKLVDGTGISMPDTPENQAHYPQPSTQAPGVGFPLARLVGVICLSTGAMMDAAMGPHAGKGHGELGLQRQLDSAFAAGDVMLADALYCNYFLIATVAANGVDVLFEQHGSRITDFRRGRSLGKRDHVVHWLKPRRPDWMSAEQYRTIPDELTVREAKVDGQILVTTLLNHRAVPKGELSKLYECRWNVELDLRNLKTTLGMDVLSCQTPQMNEKEMWVHLLAYNLIRMLMAQAAIKVGAHPRELSFKHTVQMWTEWVSHQVGFSPKHNDLLLSLIAQVRVGNRPGRLEPRARKRRPKPYPWLKIPREQARQHIRQNGHP